MTVTAGQDRDAADDTAELMHTVASADDSNYDGLTAGSVDVTVTDDDEPPAMATRGTDSARATPTLSDLTLSGATGGQVISLSPIFDSNTTSYTASVVNRIDAVTVTVTSNDKVVITNDDDLMTEAEADLDLSVGSNTVTVTVAAADATTNTYTITVTRDSAPPDPTDCPADNSWCTTMRVGHHVEIVGQDRIETFGLLSNENFGDFASATFDHEGTSYSVSNLYLRTATNLDEFVPHSRELYLETTPALPDNTVFRVGDLNLVVDSNSDKDGSGTEYWDFSGSHVNWTDGQLLTVSLRFYQFLVDRSDWRTNGGLAVNATVRQSFRTGSSTDGYRVSDVQIFTIQIDSNDIPKALIREDSEGELGALVATLTRPRGLHFYDLAVFTAPAGGVALAPDTTYWLTVNEGLQTRHRIAVMTALIPAGNDEPGWSITRRYYFRFDDEDSWTDGGARNFAMVINGTSGDMSPTGAPVISGTAKLERTLTASISGILDPDGTTKADAGDAGYAYTYQWERVDEDGLSNPVEITGATQSAYTVGIDDVGSRLRVKVSFSDDAGYDEGPLVSYVTPTVRIVDVTVSFGQGTYRVDEGDMVDVTVTLSADPERTVEIPISTDKRGGATDSDYTVTPDALTFNSGETSKRFTFMATQDDVDDDGESVRLGFENLPAGVSAGTTDEATVFITDEECSSPIWTATLQLGDETAKDWGVFRLVHHRTTPGPPSILDGDEFDLRGKDYKIRSIALDPAVQTGSVARSPYATPEMASFKISIYREGPDGRFHRVRASDYGDWTLFIDDMAFPFGDVAYTDGSSFLWRDQEFNDMFNAWSPSTTYQLCLDDTPASETIMAPPSAPKYLRLFPGYGSLVALWRVPDNDSHWLPPEFEGTEIIRYEVQIKELGDSWTNASDVLEYSVPPLEDNPQGVYTFGGLTNGVDYSVRVKAANAAGEGPYSAEAWGAPQYSRPGLSDAVVDGESLSLNFNRGLDDTSVPAASNFRVLVNGESHVPDSVMVTGSKVILTLPEPAVHVDEVHVLYILPDDIDAPRIRDGDGYYYTTSGREYIQARNETPLASLPPVTVSVESLPDSHNGVASFTFRIVFSESVKVLYSYGAGMLNVSGGSVTGSQNLDRRTERWEFTIAPHSEGDVEINLPGGRECEYGHIPCGAGERPLSNSLELTVPSLQTGSQMANSPAADGLVIAGVPRVGETLTVDTSLIEDQNGLESASFTYQWSRQDLASQVETDITGTTGSSYVLTADDRDSAIGVSVGFTDDAGNEETLTSYWVPVLQPPNSPAAGAPTISGAAQVGETLLVDTTGISDSDGLSNAVYHYQWLTHDGSSVTEIAGATSSSYTLKVDDESHAIQVRVSFTDGAGHEESLTSVATEPVSFAVQKQQANSPATGAPTISGTAQVGETLTADISGIADEEGLSSVAYRYQWLADDADITGATAAAYTLTDSEEGKTVRVRVSFTDDAGNEETLTSSATATVEARPNSPAAGQPAISGTAQVGETLTADTSGISDEDGLNQVAYRYQWLADDAAIAGATAGAYTLVEADTGAIITVTVSFTDDAGHEEMLTSKATDTVAAAEPAEPPPAPTGLTAAASHDQVVLSWDDPQDDSITGYVILRRDRAIHEPGTFVTVAADTGSADTGYTDGTVEPEKEYVYRIRAINGHGVSELSRWVRADTPAPPLPAKPTGLTAAPSHNQVVLSWDDPQDGGITGYVILRRNRATTAPGEFTELVADTGSAATTHTDGTVEPEKEYVYRIRAINGHGVSELSRWFRIDTPAAPE